MSREDRPAGAGVPTTAAAPGTGTGAGIAAPRRDIFISYASEDEARAAPLVAEFERQGWSVWWDKKLRTGEEFNVEIERALAEATVVLVLWTDSSVRKKWVKGEAARALDKEKLCTVLCDEVEIPLPFNNEHATRLLGWPSTRNDLELQGLLETIAERLKKGPVKLPPPPAWPRALATAIVLFGLLGANMLLFPFVPTISPTNLLFACAAIASVLLLTGTIFPVWGVKERVNRLFLAPGHRPRLASIAGAVLLFLAMAALAYLGRPTLTVAEVRGELPAGKGPGALILNLKNVHGGLTRPEDGYLLVTLNTGFARANDLMLTSTLMPYGYVEFAEFASEERFGFTRQIGSVASSDDKGSIVIASPRISGEARVAIRWKRPPERPAGIPPPMLEVEWRAGAWSKHVAYPLVDR